MMRKEVTYVAYYFSNYHFGNLAAWRWWLVWPWQMVQQEVANHPETVIPSDYGQ